MAQPPRCAEEAPATIGDRGIQRPPRVLIIIPAYNEQAAVGQVIASVREHCPFADMVIVNDGSTDDTQTIARAQSVKVLDLPINIGIGGAVQCGFRYAVAHNYDIGVQVDGDNQHDPRYVRAMVDRMVAEDADLVIGSRFLADCGFRSTATRRAGIRLLRWLITALGRQYVSDPTSGMRAYSRATMRALAKYYPQEYPEPECAFMLIRHGRKVVEVPVTMNERRGGKSSIGPLASILYMLKVAVAIALHMISNRIVFEETSA